MCGAEMTALADQCHHQADHHAGTGFRAQFINVVFMLARRRGSE
jgi:hypothetical protein